MMGEFLLVLLILSLILSTSLSVVSVHFRKFNSTVEKNIAIIKNSLIFLFFILPIFLIYFLLDSKPNEINTLISGKVDTNIILWATTILMLSTFFMGIISLLINYIFKLKKEIKELKEFPRKVMNNQINHQQNRRQKYV